MTFAVLWLERYGALFFFIPFKNTYFRLTAIAAFMLFHIGIMLSMELRLFQWICLISLIGFLPTSFWNKLFGPYVPKTGASPEKKLSVWEPNLFRMSPYLNVIITLFIIYVFFWNMGELENSKFGIPVQLRWIGSVFNLRQHWGMFAPRPMTDDGWCVMPGELRDGKTVDIYNSGSPVTWKEPDSIPKLDKMYHWTIYYLSIRKRKYIDYRKPWADYLCREWNSTHPYDQQLIKFKIDFMEKDTMPDYQKPYIHPILLVSYDCAHKTLY
jgi:hypothetical protein